MAAIKAKDVKPGGVFLHPETKVPLRRVEPANFPRPEGLRDAVLAVDDEGGLYAVHPDASVEQPWHVPLATREDDDNYLVVVTFERQHSDDDQVLADSHKAGRIADPKTNFAKAAAQQVNSELQEAFDNGMAGFCQAHRVIDRTGFDTDAMGWSKPHDGR